MDRILLYQWIIRLLNAYILLSIISFARGWYKWEYLQKNQEIHKRKAGAHKIIRFDQKLFREDEETLDYSDYDEPEAAALMRVEILDEEEKTGPTLGRVLGT